jgi:hypothetical protein
MKTSATTTTHLIVGSCFALALAIIIFSTAQAETAAVTGQNAAPEPKMMEHCQAMQAQKQKLLDDIKVQDTELTELLAKMNTAPDAKKVGLLAALVTRMIEQRIAMDARKAKMEDMLMQHVQMGKDAMMPDAMPKGADKK